MPLRISGYADAVAQRDEPQAVPALESPAQAPPVEVYWNRNRQVEINT